MPLQIRLQLGQRPAAIGQAHLLGRLVGDPADFGSLPGRQLRRRSRRANMMYGGYPVPIKGMKIRIEGIDVDL